MNSLSPDHNIPYMPVVLHEIKTLVAWLAVVEMRIVANLVGSFPSYFQLLNIAKI
jgi:hypothetical protein